MIPVTEVEQDELNEGPVGRMAEKNAKKVPSDLFFLAAGISLLTSLSLKFARKDDKALFVGQWVPTFLLMGLFNKLNKMAKPSL
jgi:hypothetical protein